MDARHPLRIAYERQQWLRPDWRRWYPPGFEWPEEREIARKRAELAAREAEEAAWIEIEDARAEARAHLRWMLKDLKVELMLARLRQKYSPDQPRDDRGRWTSDNADSIRVAADNQRENKIVRDVVVKLRLTPDQGQQLHREISGQGMGYHEILGRAREMFDK
jgi:hypothetical protein